MSDLLKIGSSGLLAFQQALTTTGHNISNANTEGYSRQRVENGARMPIRTGPNYIGQGVDVVKIERVVDEFLVDQVRVHTAQYGSLDKFYDLATQVDNLLADPKAGLAPAMEEFFSAVQGVADSPSSVPARQVLLSNSESLVDRFHYLDQRLGALEDRVNGQLTNVVNEINGLAQSIADLNVEIASLYSKGADARPSDLLDKRDLLLEKLSALVSVDTIELENGEVNVFIGTGQTLVVGPNVSTLGATPNDYDPTLLEVSYTRSGSTQNLTQFLSGGELGGILEFRETVLEPARNGLGRVATGLVETFNEQHRLGMDLEGDMGLDFFDLAAPTVLPHPNNVPSDVPTVAIDDVNQLSINDYYLKYDGATWTMVNAQTGATDTLPGAGGGTGTNADPYVYNGLAISVQPLSAPAAGHSFLIQPTRSASRDIELNIDHTSKVAAASPLRAKAASDANGLLTNTGSGEIGIEGVSRLATATAADDLDWSEHAPTPYIDIVFNDNGTPGVSGDDFFDVTYPDATVTTINYDSATDVGLVANLSFDGHTVAVKLAGIPDHGDSFRVENNWDMVGVDKVPGTADNTNALALAQLQSTSVMENGTVTYMGAYGQMVSSVGTLTHQAEINRDAESTLLEHAQTEREAASGVNMDEEAANMLKFQQAYQANAKVIATAQQMFESLLAAFG